MSRSYESNGPDVKIRGNALHIAEKYVTLARDAASSGDRVAEQNYLQHAEHYFRIVAAAQAQMPQPQPTQRNEDDDDNDRDDANNDRGQGNGERGQAGRRDDNEPAPAYGLSEPQPYVNGAETNGGDRDGDGGANGPSEEQPARPRRQRRPRQRENRAEPQMAGEEAAVAAED